MTDQAEMGPAGATENLSFEEALKRLEEIVRNEIPHKKPDFKIEEISMVHFEKLISPKKQPTAKEARSFMI